MQSPALAPAPVPAPGLGGNWLPGPFVGASTGRSLTPKGAEALARADPENNPGVDCVAQQAPSQMVFTDLKNIEIDGARVVLRSAVNVGVERIVHLDQTSHAGAPFTNDGHSIGRWDNGTLVVDTRNFSDHPNGNGGVPSGAQKHLVEYFELAADRTTLTYHSKTRNISRHRSKAPRFGSIGPICHTRQRRATSRTRAAISRSAEQGCRHRS